MLQNVYMHEHMYKRTDVATPHAILDHWPIWHDSIESLHVHDKNSAIFVFAVYASSASGEVLPN